LSAAAGQTPTTAGTRARTVAGVIALGLALQAAVFGLLFPHLWYNLHYITDIDIYQWYASMMHHGLQPYRDFHVEYPPLAVPLFVLPGHTGSLAQYTSWFSYLMFLFALAMTAVTGAAAAVLWPTGRRAYAVVALLALATAATGAILENRYDIVVALVIAFFTLFLIQRQLLAAAFASASASRSSSRRWPCCRWCCCSWLVRVERWAHWPCSPWPPRCRSSPT